MIKPSALAMGVVMASLAAGTYYGLDLLPPGLLPPPIGRAVAAETASTAKQVEPVEVAQAAAPAPAPAPAEEAPTEQDLAEEPAPEQAAPAPTPANEPADAAANEAEPAPQSTPEPAPATAAAPAPQPQPAPKPAAPKPTPKPAPAEQPQKAAPEKTEVASAAPATKEPAKAPPAADVIKPWWPDPSKLPANQLKLQYAGQVKDQNAIALLFTSPVKLETMQQHAQVKDAKGENVAAQWKAGKNPALAVLGGLAPGRYTVILQPQVADQKGYMLGVTLQGPVYVKE